MVVAIMRTNKIIVITGVLVLLLPGCGRKGPLKLPAPQSLAATAKATSLHTSGASQSGAPLFLNSWSFK
jgi:predicted small lipoprotein YifL